MLKRSLTTALIGGKVLAVGALMGSTVLAQNAEVIEGDATVVQTPSGNTAIVPGVAAEPGTAVGAVTEPDYPLLEQLDNDEAIARTLVAQGFTDIHILREGPMLTVNAQRGGQPIELVYSVANGSLVSVDGVKLRPEPDQSSNGRSSEPGTGTDVGDGDGDGDGDADGDTGDGTDGDGAGGDGSDGDGSDGDGAGGDGSDGDGAGGGGAGGGGDAGSDGDSGGDSGGGSDGGDGGGEGGEGDG
ncbi:hypothetical protein SAMN05421641_110102 [Paracoccus thiocyanatus]|uniref:Uncharacterized protein n=1 Tax=Paracoccus thiocyanatus TaxID=34006 RepID=A0A1N6U760_9RHOB|nr:hypothetical protein [Paracoccus thiocyanatus]SIQ61377.1 hypothetical protein SAMN05421641_110102 [Paracoccus thiocyanatus]